MLAQWRWAIETGASQGWCTSDNLNIIIIQTRLRVTMAIIITLFAPNIYIVAQ